MKTYAYVYDGLVYQVIPPEVYDAESPDWIDGDPSRIGQEKPIETRFTPEFLSTTYDITDLNPMPVQGWTYLDGVFAPYVPPVPTPEQILAQNQTQQNALAAIASQAMTPYMMSLQLGDATDEETVKAREWQSYYRDLEAVDITVLSPAWPTPPAGGS